MRSSLSLQRSLFRSQKALISRAVVSGSRTFRTYEARYQKATRTYERLAGLPEVDRAAALADLVYVGDYHTLRASQASFLRLLRAAVKSGRRVEVALEFVEGRHQKALDRFQAGRMGEKTFLARIGHPYSSDFDIWPGFRPILELAREAGLGVHAIDLRAHGPGSLARRDAYAAERLARLTQAKDRPLVLVLVGQYHVTPCHLPAKVRARARRPLKSLVVYQNCESVWWQLLRRGRAGEVEAVRIREGEYCLVNTSPLLCQQSFLDYLEAESGDAPLVEDGARERFREMARLIGRFTGVRLGQRLDEVAVLTPGEPRALEQIRARGRLRPREVEQVRRQILARESYYIPRAKAAYLASLSLNHAAEEAAHFVRHCAIGPAMDAPRSPQDAFYARCVEEALGFFGSRLVNPRRTCRNLEDWARDFQRRRGEERQIAAFLLAHKAAEAEGPKEAQKLVPLRTDRLFNAVSHGLGYVLGDALHRAFVEGRISRAEVRAWFRDPLADPRAAYFGWVAKAG